jgi:pimeloyl-ACP methyl ester carboxylesterase
MTPLGWGRRFARLAATVVVATTVAGAGTSRAATPIMRVELHLARGATTSPHLLLLTVGGPVYCMQLENLARNVDASLACTDYGPNRYEGQGGRAGRREDWGDPTYLAAVARLPSRLRAEGVKISKLVVLGVSYSGYANAELVATHPEIRADALIVVDSYLDLPARYNALPPTHETRKEIETVLGGTLQQEPQAYAARSPSHHLAGLATAIRAGMKLVVVWSTSREEEREFRGATCSRLANAQWLSGLARTLNQPVTGYVTQLPHAHALWDRGRGLLALAGIGSTTKPLLARAVAFAPGAQPPAGSYCPSAFP